ncbi:phage head morphogenesis protein [Bradyrhizobium genosp. L]|nr:phage head morphogenesis protein [Bradyrhizobium genosp. L]
MAASYLYWVKATYRANEPAIAQDETPAVALKRRISRLGAQWTKKFDQAADDLAKWFAEAASKRSSAALRSILKKGGFSVEFKLTPAVRDILQATIAENVSLIKSIPSQYLTNVEGLVMRSVTAGRDLAQLTKDLQEQHGVTRRRASRIALDQNNKATAAITRARQVDLGITEAIWVHSGGGKHPRPTHLKAGRERTKYTIKDGWYDPAVGKNIWPGELVNCRCVCRAVVPGFS